MSLPRLPLNQLLPAPRFAEDAAFKIVGLGGVGGIVARHLAIFLGATRRPARLVLMDGDSFEPANSSRMLFGSCGNKAAVVRNDLLPQVLDTPLTVLAVENFLDPDNIRKLIFDGDYVLLCVDNHATRKLVSDFCAAQLSDVCLVSGGNDGVVAGEGDEVRRGTFGNAQIHVRMDRIDHTPPITHRHPEIESPADRLPTDQNCTESIQSTPQILFANLMAASCMLNALWLHLCGALHYGEVAFDIAEGLMRPVELRPQVKPRLPAVPPPGTRHARPRPHEE